MDRRPLFFTLGLLVAGLPGTSGGTPSAGATDAGTAAARPEGPPPTRQNTESIWSKVDVAPTKTSIYVGTVSLRMPTFVRQGATFSAPYSAKVFPYFFYNEDGTLTVDVTDEQLRSLAGGQQIKFEGTAVTHDGATRKVTARATPKDATNGKLDVHVWVSNRIQLIFHTTYHFAG